MAVKKSELYSMLWEGCNKLRGGVEPSRYKDYVLLLLFFKYVSDRYKGQPFAEFTVSNGASFEDLIAAKGKSDVGERVDKIIQKFLEDNKLLGSLPDVSFNNPEELGSGKELVDKVSGLISVFQNPSIDFKNNRASGDDIIGDAYEYFMMKFAQESGKSKGQFYTPSEVSRIIARLIGIGNIKQTATKKWTLYDPAAGSGSLLIRSADEAPVDENGDSIVTIFGQEKYPDTAGLAKMNFILHNKGTGEIKSGNTLSAPQYLDEFEELKKFDFIVMNPPFSDKSWTDGIKKDFQSILVTVPDKPEQEEIARTLFLFDAYIDDLAELIEKKKGIRDGALEDLMSGKTRIGGFKTEWAEYPFEVYFSTLPNNTFSRDKLSEHGEIGDIHYGDVLIKYGDVLTDDDSIPRIKDISQVKENWYLRKHDVIIADTAEDEAVGKVVQIGTVSIPLVGGLHTVVCRPNYDTAEGFLGYYMNSKLYHDQLYPYITGIKVSSISKKSFGETMLNIPADVNEQAAIVSVLSAMDNEIRDLETEREKIIQIREGAMDDLLTGRVRLTK